MNRREVIALAVVIALDPFTAAADLTGSARLHKADAKCRRAGRVRERFGLTEHERAYLVDHMRCQKIDGEWRTTMIAQAD